MTENSSTATGWTLFLDRDGVINQRLPGDYVKNPEQFIFIDGVKTAMERLSHIFPTIILVTNQQGIGKKLMTADDLEKVHLKMQNGILQSGGRIDAIFYCTALEAENHPDRKPSPGMALRAQKAFPHIQFSKSIMVGDSDSDILFGKNLGMITVFLSEEKTVPSCKADYHFKNLEDFSLWLKLHQKSVLL